MRLQDFPASTAKRFRLPATWGALLVFGLVWVLVRLLAGQPFGRLGVGEFVVPALVLAGHLALSPIPWQWTQDARPIAPLWRGCLQALPWNIAWLAALLLLMSGLFPEDRPAPKPRPAPAAEAKSALVLQEREDPKPQEGQEPTARGRRRRDPARDQEAKPPHNPGEVPWHLLPPEERRGPRPPRREGDEPLRERAPRPRDAAPQYRGVPPRPPLAQPQREPAAAVPAPIPLVLATPATEAQEPAASEPAGAPGLFAKTFPAHRQEFMLFLLNLPFAMVLGWFLADKERAESTEAELLERARQAQVRALQAQLHPHALYNILGGLAELVHEDPDAAEEAIVGLVEMLRMLTRQSGASELPLGQERALLRHYLGIEGIRLGARLQVKWDWPEWADAVKLPPLLLLPLVENAIKHGIAAHLEGGTLRIGVSRSSRDLIFRVANTGQPLKPGEAEGTGLHHLRERLTLTPSLDASLELRSEDGWTLAELRVRDRLGA
jgi:hypothetical protein